MKDLDALLTRAAGPATTSFTTADVSRRVHRRRRTRRAAVVLGVVAVVATAGMLAGRDSGTRSVQAADRPGRAAVSPVGRWTLTAVSDVIAIDGILPHVVFAAEGTLTVDTGCRQLRGTWSTNRDVLRVSLITPTEPRRCEGAPADVERLLIERFSQPLTIGRFENTAGTLRLTDGSHFMAWRRTVRDSVTEYDGSAVRRGTFKLVWIPTGSDTHVGPHANPNNTYRWEPEAAVGQHRAFYGVALHAKASSRLDVIYDDGTLSIIASDLTHDEMFDVAIGAQRRGNTFITTDAPPGFRAIASTPLEG